MNKRHFNQHMKKLLIASPLKWRATAKCERPAATDEWTGHKVVLFKDDSISREEMGG
jgi:hypothetical protein